MSEPSRKRARITPRNSEADATIAAAANVTPFNDLHQLGKVIHKPNTPQARTPVARPGSASRSAPRRTTATNPTPNTASRTPRRTPTTQIHSATRFAVRRGPPTTPHGIRALQQRRNATATPGRDRRRSGRAQRETPRDDLRALSRLMAKHSKPIEPSPEAPPYSKRKSIRDDLFSGDEENEPPPRLSAPLGSDEDTGSWHEPPRLSLPLDDEAQGEEENATMRSVEAGRRALMTRESYGEPSFTGPMAELQEMDEEALPAMGDAIPDMDITGPISEGYGFDETPSSVDLLTLPSDATGELRRAIFGESQGRISGLSGASASSPGPLSDGEPTFQFRFPERRRSALLPQAQLTTAAEEEEHPQTLIDDEAGPAPDDEIEDYESASSSDEAAQTALQSTRAIIPQSTTDVLPQSRPKCTTAPRELLASKHGIPYPQLPLPLVKTVAQSFSRQHTGSSKLSKDTVLALQQASDWFFEQASEDLAAYAEHAGRKTIDESDVVTLMGRQRVLGAAQKQTLFSLAERFLPRELLQEVKMTKVETRKVKAKGRGRKRKLATIEEEAEEVTMD